MRKVLTVVLMFVFVLSITSIAMAASTNPFVDVPPDHWAYAAVDKLAQAGIIEGYGDGTYRGQRTITRYEMAQMVAKAMSRSDKADAELKALIDKLAVEYADELTNLGVRVSKLEEKTRIGWNFESRIRYNNYDFNSNSYPEGTNKFDWRQRIILSGDVNDNVSYVARLESKYDKYTEGSNNGNVPFGAGGNVTIGFSQAQFNVKNFLGAFDNLSAGRLDTRGVTNGLLSAKDGNCDGVMVSKTFGDVTFTGLFADYPGVNSATSGSEVSLYNLDYKVDNNLKLNVGYQQGDWNRASWNYPAPPYMLYYDTKSWDAGMQYKIGDYYLTGEYVNTKREDSSAPHSKAWAVQVTNGMTGYLYPTYNLVDPKKAHTDAFSLSYRKVDDIATPITSVFNTCNSYYFSLPFDYDTKGYYLAYQNVVSKNVIWSVEYQDLKYDDNLKYKYWNTSFQFFF